MSGTSKTEGGIKLVDLAKFHFDFKFQAIKMRLDGLKVLVTGGASGLGAATAARFARASCQVAIWDLNAEAGTRKASEIGARFYQN